MDSKREMQILHFLDDLTEDEREYVKNQIKRDW
jgi:hypothetical protein